MEITLPNGKKVEEVKNIKKESTEIKTNLSIQLDEAKARRKLSDLPDVSNISIYSQILCYEMYGLSTRDIALTIKITEEQVTTIRMSYEYNKYKTDFLKSIKETETEDVREFIAKSSKKAAEKIVNIMETGPVKFALDAAKDIMDRSGHRPSDIADLRSISDNELRVLVINKDETKDKQAQLIVVQDAEFEEIK